MTVTYTTKTGQTQYKPSFKWIESVVHSDGDWGFCLGCGNHQTGCEPDARRYKCDDCGAAKVYGAEELALMGPVPQHRLTTPPSPPPRPTPPPSRRRETRRTTPMSAYETVTNTIIAMLEAGTAPWSKPWASGGPMGRPLRATGEGYQGVNTLILWCAAQEHGYQSRYWLTYKAAQAAGGQVRKGEKATTVFFFTKVVKGATDAEDAKMFPMMKSYSVFNADQCDGMTAPYTVPAAPPVPMPIGERHAGVDAFVAATHADIRHGGVRAFFRPSQDLVQMPQFADFNSPEAYYAVLLHELTHWSGHKSRLDRTLKGRFGDPDYAFEELIAELGAAYLCADLGVSSEPRPDHASYIASWIKGLREDPRAIFRAAAAAEKAAAYLHAAAEPMAVAA